MNNMTVGRALQKAYARLKPHTQAGLPDRQAWREDAEMLLAELLQKDTTYLFAHADAPLTLWQRLRYYRMISRRCKHEPIQYITGRAYFFGHEFLVERGRVLIPRPETELLVERAITLYRERACEVVDVGTGSGCIAISIARACPSAHISAVDYSCDALDIAIRNAKHLGVHERITFVEDDLLTQAHQYLPTNDRPLLFVMNLPYLSTAQMKTIPPDVSVFEPHTALMAGEDGLDAYRRVLAQIREYCTARRREARILFEIDPAQAQMIPNLLNSLRLTDRMFTMHKDYAGLDRLIELHIAQKKKF